MFLVEFLLPVADNDGARIPKDEFDRVRRDDLVSLEVMTETLDRQWWRSYREELGKRFRQQES